MPTGVQNYQNGKIYKIWSLMTNNIYIGSTTNDLPHRFSRHFYAYKCNSRLLFEEVGFENCKIELIEYYPCNSKLELEKREGELQREYKEFIVNRKISGRTQQEHYEDNKERIKERVKKYSEKNKDKILKKQNEKYTCECGSTFKKYYKIEHETTKKHINYIQSSSSSSSLS